MRQGFWRHFGMRFRWRRRFCWRLPSCTRARRCWKGASKAAYPQGDFAGGAVCIRDRAFDRRALRLPFVGTLHAARLGEGAEVVRKQADGALKGCCDFLEERLGIPAKELEQEFSETWDALAGQLKKEALPKAVDRSVEGCRLLISAAGFIGIWMIASVLLCRDYEEIAEKIQKTELGKTVWQYAERTLFLIGGYFKAQAAILTAISLIAAAGLFAAGIKNGIWIGIAAGVLDALPFIGTGLVLFPMAVWQLILGNTGKVLMIAAVYAGCVIVREYLEPKLLGRQAGMYPVVMLFSVYAGVKLFGLSGIF